MHFGLTEASRSTFLEFHRDKKKLNSIGRATPNVQVKIADTDGKELKHGNSGTIWVKGKMVMASYFRNPQVTQQVLRDGWLDTHGKGQFHAGQTAQRHRGFGRNRFLPLHESLRATSVSLWPGRGHGTQL